MIVRLIKKNQIYNFLLPKKISGNYWITDIDSMGGERNLINIDSEKNNWKIKSNYETKIIDNNKEIESTTLEEYHSYFLKINNENEFVILYCSPSIEPQEVKLTLRHDTELIIGNDSSAHINYNCPLISKQNSKLTYTNGTWVIEDLESKYGTYVNNYSVIRKELEYGDIIFIMGLKIVVMKDKISINNISNLVKFDGHKFVIEKALVQKQTEFEKEDDEIIDFYKDNDFFYRSPRFKTSIEDITIKIDSPPSKEQEDKTPMLYTLAPMFAMSMMSMTSIYGSLNSVLNGTNDLSEAAPTLIMGGAMFSSMIIIPLLLRNYQKNEKIKKEKLRQKKYIEYLNEKRDAIQAEMKIQRQILIDNYLPLEATIEIIYNKKRNLWEREIEQADFLDLRLGIGKTELKGQIAFPEEHFSLDEDNLLKEVYKLSSESRMLENVPISLSFTKNNISAIIGDSSIKDDFIKGLLLQVFAYHSYEDLKIVILTNKTNYEKWEVYKDCPHIWSDDKSIRYFSSTIDETKQISLYLEQELNARKYKQDTEKMELSTDDYTHHTPYYLVITDNYKEIRDIDIIRDICETPINYGFSLVVINKRLVNLPNACKTFISIGDQQSGVFENELVSNKQKEFVADYSKVVNMREICQILSNIPIDGLSKENRTLPTKLSFLEMYNIGKVEQFNLINRWKKNDPTKSLAVPVGFDKTQELFKLDLHEKAHGPHGLIAGMTGSGKSEFIITYILSMALNYHPYEVQFVLIDYKGGGLAGAFENKDTGIKLPHLVGTITNLDTVEMNRSLASIQSELRRRQTLFNEARDKLDESTIDIYKYQSLYRAGKVSIPISHLLIISDEFAELKAQQPDFMDQLISTARIGRSLGVHLILATQKPSGVVNDQIWSNSRFRVCLKVQDRSDSNDMIKVPDAAEIKNAGRFFLQVGYNELFSQGQAAWAGAPYYPMEKRKKRVDQSINIIDDVGNVVESLEDTRFQEHLVSQGEEVTNIIKYIIEESKSENIKLSKLWLDRIPDVIYVEDLKKKYHYTTEYNTILPVIGEYDDPENQRQEVLTLPITNGGNTIIFGSAGSGKELMLTSIIYSCITTHTSKEINFYILDFGGETLAQFKDAPHIGEVLLENDGEKIENLFKMLVSTLDDRRKKFVDYNGSYDFYIRHGGKQIPMIIVAINNVEAFLESYEQYEEIMQQLTRDSLKYGMMFIFTTNAYNTIRYRLRQNFSQNLVLQFNDPGDYSSVIPGVRKKQPSKAFGRGMILLDNIYEFQTAYPYREEKMTEYIKTICKKLNKICTFKAKKIPILPEIVDVEFLQDSLNGISEIPVGVEKNSLEISTIDLESNPTYIITSDDVSSNTNFISGFINIVSQLENSKIIVFDTSSILKEFKQNIIIYSKNDSELSKQAIIDFYDNNLKENCICVFIGITNYLNKVSSDDKEKIQEILSNSIKISNLRIILIDNIDKIKSIAYEQWFKATAQLSEALWLGNGINNQYTLKVTTSSRVLRQEIQDNFGYNIKKGKAELVKFINE